MYIEFIIISIISIIIVLFQRNKITNVLKTEMNGIHFILTGVFLQFVSVYIFKRNKNTNLYEFVINYYLIITCFTYLFILAGIGLDIKKNYMKFLFMGTLLNFIVILANGCKMPVLILEEMTNSSLNKVYLESGKDLIHTIVNKDTNLRFLSDIIALKSPYPFVKTISIGDVFLLFGVFVFWQEECRR